LHDLPDRSLAAAALWAGFGLLAYSFAEYAFHRWVLHGFRVPGHLDHHLAPSEPLALPFSTGLSVHALLLLLLTVGLGSAPAIWAIFGSAFGYAAFCQLHELEHQHPSLALRLLPALHRHHMRHHEGCRGSMTGAGAGCNYGVLTTLWDRMFNTYRA
jgi:sterol desaturase/sphingolipid hydroxylase (fatty acid hydroxylase superfamily)